MKDKPINTLDELNSFVVDVFNAHGNMISTSEGIRAIDKAFKEFKDKTTILIEPRTAAGSLD